MNNKDDVIYEITIDEYKAVANLKDAKKIYVENKLICLSVGEIVSFENEFKNLTSNLLIEVMYDSDTKKQLTTKITKLESFGSVVAIDPNFKDNKVLDKLKELNILSDMIETVSYEDKQYDLSKVNLSELMLYKPFGETTLKNYKAIEERREKMKEKEL